LNPLLLLLVACADAAPPEPDPGITLEGVVATAPSGTRLAARTATGTPTGPGEASGVTGSLVAEAAAPPLEVTAERSTWDLKNGELHLEGDVVAVRAGARLRCASADVRFDGDGAVTRIEASGGVVLEQGARTGRAQTALLEAGSGRVTLRGQASLAEPPHEMTGEPIIVYLDDERIECESCRMRIDGAGIGRGD
jgi:lipopolysaccharide export system protein LptA